MNVAGTGCNSQRLVLFRLSTCSLPPSATRQPRLTSSQLTYPKTSQPPSLRVSCTTRSQMRAPNGVNSEARCGVVVGSQCDDMCVVVGFCFPDSLSPIRQPARPPLHVCGGPGTRPDGTGTLTHIARQSQMRIIVVGGGTAPWRHDGYRGVGAHVEGRDAWETPLVLPGYLPQGGW